MVLVRTGRAAQQNVAAVKPSMTAMNRMKDFLRGLRLNV